MRRDSPSRARFLESRKRILTAAGFEDHLRQDGVPFHYTRREGGGPAVVCLHGLGDSSLTFPEFLNAPPFRDREVVIPDIPGFGASPRRPETTRTLRGQAQAVLALLDGLSISRFAVIGHSMGGAVATHLGEMAPDRLAGIVNLEGNLTPSDCTLSAEAVEADAKGAYLEWRDSIRPRLESWGAGGEEGVTRFAISFPAAAAGSYLESAYGLVEESAGSRLGSRYAALPMPRLYVHGGRSSPAETQAFVRDQGLLESFHPDAGHWPHWDRRDEVAEVCRDFLESLPA